MTSLALSIFIAGFVISFAWFLYSLKHAPIGYEDEYGFHFGNVEDSKAGSDD